MFRCSEEELERALENACRMSLTRLSRIPGGYEIRTSRQSMQIHVRAARLGIALRFRGPWRDGKGALLRKVIAKQFEPVIPRLRIRLRKREAAIRY